MTQLTPAMREFLNKPRFAVVATIRPDGLPHQTVMWFALQDDGTVLLNTPFDSLKHRHLKRDSHISVCVEDGYRYLTMLGKVTINEDAGEAGADYAMLNRRYQETLPAFRRGDDAERPAYLDRARVSMRLEIESIVSNGID